MSYILTTTVITPADSHDLITIENLKLDLGITTDADDEYLARAISRASAVASAYCDRVFALEKVKDVFTSIFTSGPLRLSRYPVTEITSITSDGELLVDGEDYAIDLEVGYVQLLGASWGDIVEVLYEGGYDTIPLDIQSAVGELTKGLQFSRSRDPMLKSENILSGLYAYTLFDGSAAVGFPKHVSAMLDPYRTPVL